MPIISIVSIVSPLFPLVVALLGNRKSIWQYSLCCFFFDIAISWTAHYADSESGVKNEIKYILANAFFLSEYFFVALIYSTWLLPKRLWPRIVFVLAPIVAFLVHLTSIGFTKFDTVAASLFHFLYIIFGLVGLAILLNKRNLSRVQTAFYFWINVAFLIYGASNFLMFLFRDLLLHQEKEIFLMMWVWGHALINVLKNIFLGFACIALPTTQQIK